MTTGMIGTNDDSQTKAFESLEIQEPDIEAEHTVNWFGSLNKQEQRFHILFYALAGLTGILVVQLIWQIAVLTTQ